MAGRGHTRFPARAILNADVTPKLAPNTRFSAHNTGFFFRPTDLPIFFLENASIHAGHTHQLGVEDEDRNFF
jgi:hypothetical protein